VSYDAASRYMVEVSAGLRDAGPRFDEIRMSLRLVRHERGEQDVFAVLADVRRVPESQLEAQLTAVTVVPKTADGWLLTLERTSPWPLDMLPARPSAAQATLVARRVRQDEAERLRADRAKILQKVLSVLRSYGIDPSIETADVEVEIVVDTHWEAVRAEHGLDGFRRVPVWQPTLRHVMRDRRRTVEVMERALRRPVATPTEAEATARQMSSLRDFQDRIKI